MYLKTGPVFACSFTNHYKKTEPSILYNRIQKDEICNWDVIPLFRLIYKYENNDSTLYWIMNLFVLLRQSKWWYAIFFFHSGSFSLRCLTRNFSRSYIIIKWSRDKVATIFTFSSSIFLEKLSVINFIFILISTFVLSKLRSYLRNGNATTRP